GFMDGMALRLPTVCVRPGKPNAAASGFFSNIIREPLVGMEAVLPVDDGLVHWHASPRATVGFLLHAITMDTAAVGHDRGITMPGIAVSVAEQLDALERIAGPQARALVRHEPDPAVAEIVTNWPASFDARRGGALGFKAEQSFDAIIRTHIEDEQIVL
ncbi:MAG: NAD-dependent epimerase, partial [Pseudomonadota bacterium]